MAKLEAAAAEARGAERAAIERRNATLLQNEQGAGVAKGARKRKALADKRLRRKTWCTIGAIGAAVIVAIISFAAASRIDFAAAVVDAGSSRGAPSNPSTPRDGGWQYVPRQTPTTTPATSTPTPVPSPSVTPSPGDEGYATPPPPATLLLHRSDRGRKGLALFEPPSGPGLSPTEPSQEEDKALERPAPVPDLDLDGVGEPAPAPDLPLHGEFRDSNNATHPFTATPFECVTVQPVTYIVTVANPYIHHLSYNDIWGPPMPYFDWRPWGGSLLDNCCLGCCCALCDSRGSYSSFSADKAALACVHDHYDILVSMSTAIRSMVIIATIYARTSDTRVDIFDTVICITCLLLLSSKASRGVTTFLDFTYVRFIHLREH